MMFQETMILPKNGEEPNLIFGKTLDCNDKDKKLLCEYLKNRGTEPVYELLINKGLPLRLYFDDDGDNTVDLEKLTKEECVDIMKNRNEENIKKLNDYFNDIDLDLSISSYCGKDLSDPKNNKYYGKRKLSFHYIISNVKGTMEQNKELAKVFGWDTSIYPTKLGGKQAFRIGKFHKYGKSKRTGGDESHRKPKLLTNKQDISKHIIQFVDNDCFDFNRRYTFGFKPPVTIENFANSDTDNTDIENTIQIDEEDKPICPILKDLPPNYVNNYNDWLKITLYYKQCGTYESWCEWCKTCPRYNPSWDSKNKQLWESRPVYNGDGKKAIQKLTNPLNLKRQSELFKIFNADINDTVIVDDLIEQFNPYFKVVNYKKDDIYVYNRDTDLWEAVVKDYLNCYLSKYWMPHLNQLSYIVSTEVVEEEDTMVKSKWFGKLELNAYKKAKQKFQNNINSQGNTKTKNNFIKEFFLRDIIKDEKFKQKLNTQKHILSVKGGKVNLKTKEFSYRCQEDYLSYELDLEYNSNAKNKAFEDFVLDILTPVVDNNEGQSSRNYLQRYLGYSITGETKQEKILVLMGNGSNGKSKLFSMLQNVLKANVDMVGNWNADLFNENTSSNNVNNASPEIAKLYGKRLGFINESKKSMVWGETFKKLVDTGSSLNARELYGASFEFDLSTTFIMCSNEFPNFPIQNCFIRRIDTLELMNRYCDMDKRNSSEITANDKPININIINKVCGNIESKQGILNWIIEGAFEYYKDKKLLDIPASQQRKKEEYISGNDWFKNFTITEDKKDFIAVNSIYENINLLTSCRVKKDEMISRFVEAGAKLARKVVDGKRIPILRCVKDNIEDEDKECLIEFEHSN
jgi:P4 family phage/plasmid primase-like protien